ncbi:MAG: hypothetical protein JNL32_07095, partial [Candidatus Kapabacteria bacterium]|nr:hypothetical protein [Candidatus Kapabacteria bacterium]
MNIIKKIVMKIINFTWKQLLYFTAVMPVIYFVIMFNGCTGAKIGRQYVIEDGWVKISQTFYHLWIPSNFDTHYQYGCGGFTLTWRYNCNASSIFISSEGSIDTHNVMIDFLLPENYWMLSNNHDSCLMFKKDINEYLTYNSYKTFRESDSAARYRSNKYFKNGDTLTYEGTHDRYYVLWKIVRNRNAICFVADKSNLIVY